MNLSVAGAGCSRPRVGRWLVSDVAGACVAESAAGCDAAVAEMDASDAFELHADADSFAEKDGAGGAEHGAPCDDEGAYDVGDDVHVAVQDDVHPVRRHVLDAAQLGHILHIPDLADSTASSYPYYQARAILGQTTTKKITLQLPLSTLTAQTHYIILIFHLIRLSR